MSYSFGIGEPRIEAFPASWICRPELTDLDRIVTADVLARLRGEAEVVARHLSTLDAAPSGAGRRRDRLGPCLTRFD